MNFDLLVLTPTLGTSRYLEESVACVSRLGLKVCHLFVCPPAQVEPLRVRYPNCLVVQDDGPKAGLYGALNAGLREARRLDLQWNWYTYINDDDLLAPGFESMLKQHLARAGTDTVGFGDIMNIDAAGQAMGRMTVEKDPRNFASVLRAGISPTGQQGMFFGVAVVRALGQYTLDYRVCGDLDFWVRAFAANFRFHFYPLHVGSFRIQSGQISGDYLLTARELATITQRHLGEKRVSPWETTTTRWRYRLMNSPRYFERWRALGRVPTSKDIMENAPTAIRTTAGRE